MSSRTSPVGNASGCQSDDPGSKPPRVVCESIIMGIQIGTFGKRQIPKTQPRDVYLKSTLAQELTVVAPGRTPLTILQISQKNGNQSDCPKSCGSFGKREWDTAHGIRVRGEGAFARDLF